MRLTMHISLFFSVTVFEWMPLSSRSRNPDPLWCPSHRLLLRRLEEFPPNAPDKAATSQFISVSRNTQTESSSPEISSSKFCRKVVKAKTVEKKRLNGALFRSTKSSCLVFCATFLCPENYQTSKQKHQRVPRQEDFSSFLSMTETWSWNGTQRVEAETGAHTFQQCCVQNAVFILEKIGSQHHPREPGRRILDTNLASLIPEAQHTTDESTSHFTHSQLHLARKLQPWIQTIFQDPSSCQFARRFGLAFRNPARSGCAWVSASVMRKPGRLIDGKLLASFRFRIVRKILPSFLG